MYVCLCRAVTRGEIREAIAAGDTSPVQIARRTGAGTGCGACIRRTCAMLRSRGFEAEPPEDHDRFLTEVHLPAVPVDAVSAV